jgi:hypothetical protein
MTVFEKACQCSGVGNTKLDVHESLWLKLEHITNQLNTLAAHDNAVTILANVQSTVQLEINFAISGVS